MEYWLFLRVISQRKWLIIGLIAIALGTAQWANLRSPIPVEAKTSILFNFKMPRDVAVYEDELGYGASTSVANFNFLALFKSNEVLEEAYALADSRVKLAPVDFQTMKMQSRADLSVMKVGGKEEKTSVVDIIVILNSEDKAIAVCNALAEVAIKRYKEILTKEVVKSRQYLEEQVNNAKTELDASQIKLEEFIQENPEFTRYLDRTTFTSETMKSESNIVDIEVQLATVNAQINTVKDEIDEYTSKPIDQIPASIQASMLINDLRGNLVKKQLDLDQLLKRYKEDFPQVRKLQADISEIRLTLYKTYQTLLNERLSALEDRRNELQSGHSQLQIVQTDASTQFNTFSIKQLKYNELARDLSVAENVYRLMREKLDEAKIREDEAKNRYTLEIIDSPKKAYKKQEFYFKPAFKLIFAFLGSLLFSLVLVFLMDYFEVRYKTTTDISRIIDEPVLGEIPEYRAKSRGGKR